MQKNLDKNHVSIDPDMLEILMQFAEKHADGNHFTDDLKRVKRHIRKFNPKSLERKKQIEKEDNDLLIMAEERKEAKRTRRMVSERFETKTVVRDGKTEKVKTPFVFWFVRQNVKRAWPILIHTLRKDYGMTSVSCSFLSSKDKGEAMYMYTGLNVPSILSTKDIYLSRDEIPEGIQICDSALAPKLDLRAGNECCANPVYDEGKCTQCGNLDPELESCCDNEDRNWNGGCNNCGDPCL